jgi:hypothetical protein
MLTGCGSAAVEPATTSAPAAAPTPSAPVTAAAPGEAEARAAAEAFVRAQGYADTPPTVSEDAIVHEGIEGTIEDRLNSLDPHAVSVGRIGNGWGAVFRYVNPAYAGRGRQLLMPEGETPHFVHQDRLLGPTP